MKRFGYYVVNYLYGFCSTLFVFTSLDYYWHGEFLLGENLFMAVFFPIAFVAINISNVTETLQDAGYKIRGLYDIYKIKPETIISDIQIEELVNRLTTLPEFKKLSLSIDHDNQLVVSKKRLLVFKTIYKFQVTQIDNSVSILANLSYLFYRRDGAILLLLAAMAKSTKL